MPWASCLLMIWFRNGTSLRNIQDKTRSPESRCRGLKVHGSFVLAVSFLFPSLSFFPSLPPTLFPFIPFSSQREEERERETRLISSVILLSWFVCVCCVWHVTMSRQSTSLLFYYFLLYSFLFFFALFTSRAPLAAAKTEQKTQKRRHVAKGSGTWQRPTIVELTQFAISAAQ